MKILELAAVAAAALMVFAGVASATVLTNGEGAQLGVGTAIHATAELTIEPVTLHPPIGDIECETSTLSGVVEDEGSLTNTAKGAIGTLTFQDCGAHVTVINSGGLEIHTKTASADGNGTLTSSGASVTVVFSGFHCVFGTNNTDIGTLTGSKTGNATLDIEAKIPRTGGSSGIFCGGDAEWTGNYVVDNPSILYVD